jgi:hypothetical protein
MELQFTTERRPVRRRRHCRAPNRSAPCSTGNASTICCASHSAVGCRVTANQSSCRRRGPSRQTQTGTRTSGLEPRIGRSPRSRPHGYAGMSAQFCDGGPRCRSMYLETGRSRTRASAAQHGCAGGPHRVFSLLIRWMSSRNSGSILGLPCLYRKLDSTVMVMKSAEDRHRCDAAYVLDGAMDRSVFAKRPMSPQLVIISGILRQDPA